MADLSTKHVVAWKRKRAARKKRNKLSPTAATQARTRAWLRFYAEYGDVYDLPGPMTWHGGWFEQIPTDGSSWSPDWICGVEIGRSNDLVWPPLPATLHDWFWRIGGGKGRFLMSNRAFRDYLFLYVMELVDTELWTEREVRFWCGLYAWTVGTALAARSFNWRRV